MLFISILIILIQFTKIYGIITNFHIRTRQIMKIKRQKSHFNAHNRTKAILSSISFVRNNKTQSRALFS